MGIDFQCSIPGPLIVVNEGDYVELTLSNPKTSTLAHNVDFHAATGALGGAGLTLVQPGEEVVLRWKAIKPGVFVYHCAPGGTMIPFHVISGMNGAIMVLPKDGLKDSKAKPYKYDKAFYIGEQDFYLPKDASGKFKSYGSPAEGMADMLEVAKGLVPTHVVFNGAVGAITGDNALKAKVGEKVLFVHSQANRDSRPHLIGGHADLYWGRLFKDTRSARDRHRACYAVARREGHSADVTRVAPILGSAAWTPSGPASIPQWYVSSKLEFRDEIRSWLAAVVIARVGALPAGRHMHVVSHFPQGERHGCRQ